MAKESSIVSAIVGSARADGWWVMKIHGGPHQVSGVPDLLCVKSGRAVFLEVKQPGKKPTPIQVFRMNEIRSVGGAVCEVVTSRKEADAVLQDHSSSECRNAIDKSVLRAERRRSV